MKWLSCKACEVLRTEVEHLLKQNAKLAEQVIALADPHASRLLLARDMPVKNEKSEFRRMEYNDFGEQVWSEDA